MKKGSVIRIFLTVAAIAGMFLLVLLLQSCNNGADGDTEITSEQTDLSIESTAEEQTENETTESEETTMAEELTTELATSELETDENGDYISVAPYYVCLYTGVIDSDVKGTYDTLEAATKACDKVKQLGYRVCDANGVAVYLPYTELQCDLVREGKWVTDYVRTHGFTYGDAPINPAINCDAKKVSCDRLVTWVYYRIGYTDQPYTQGLTIGNFFDWCEEHGFEKITKVKDLQPGDIVGVRPQNNGAYPGHVYLFAGYINKTTFYRYDCGSDYRIQYNQPMTDPMEEFMCAYRPVWREGTMSRSGEGNEVKDIPLGYACWLYNYASKAEWNDATDEELTYNFEFTVEGVKYLYSSTRNCLCEAETGRYVKVKVGDRETFKELIAIIKE